MTLSNRKVYNWYISMVAATCMILTGYDASVFNAVQGSNAFMSYVGHPKSDVIGSTNTAYTCGAIITGFFIAGPLSKYTGRRIPMAVGALIVIAATIVQVMSPAGHINYFLAGRILVGIAQGACLPIGPVYIAEVAPAKIRGQMVAFWQLFYSVGSAICFWISYAASVHRTALPNNWDWKLIVIFQLLAPIFILANLPLIPESPRWLMQKGKHQQARNVLTRIRDAEDDIDEECREIAAAIEYEEAHLSGSYKPLWIDTSLRRRVILSFLLNAGQQLTGQSCLNAYSTKVYKKIYKNPNTVQLINAGNGTFAIFFTLFALLADRFGRRPFLLTGSVGMATLMLCVALVETQTPTLAGGAKSKGVGAGIIICLYTFALFYKPTWGATVWIWTSEIFSMNVRGQAMGMASQMQNVTNLIINQVFPDIFDKIGFYSFLIFFGINIILGIYVFFFIAETKGRTLEEIDIIFGGVNHAQEGLREKIVHGEDAYSSDRSKDDYK